MLYKTNCNNREILLKKKSYFINKIGIVFHSFLKNIKKKLAF